MRWEGLLCVLVAANWVDPCEDGTLRTPLDHSVWSAVLSTKVFAGTVSNVFTHVVDYAALAADPAQFRIYLGQFCAVDLADLLPAARLALLCNAYNVFMVALILKYSPDNSVLEVNDVWNVPIGTIGGQKMSLDYIEHTLIRGGLSEEVGVRGRAHAGLVCGSVSCPSLPCTAFEATTVVEQLTDATRVWLSNPSKNVAPNMPSMILSWYGADFEAESGSVAAFLREYASWDAVGSLEFVEYGWELNQVNAIAELTPLRCGTAPTEGPPAQGSVKTGNGGSGGLSQDSGSESDTADPFADPCEDVIDAPRLDHDSFGRVLSKFVKTAQTKHGIKASLVDYKGLQESPADLRLYLRQLCIVDLEAFSKVERLALLINAYNALMLWVVIKHAPQETVTEIKDVWKRKFTKVGGQEVSLDDLEHTMVRGGLSADLGVSGRAHAGFVCASLSCPDLLPEPFLPATVIDQLTAATLTWLTNPTKNEGGDNGKARVSMIFSWYGDDFVAESGSIQAYLKTYGGDAFSGLSSDAEIEFLDYDWRLNAASIPVSSVCRPMRFLSISAFAVLISVGFL